MQLEVGMVLEGKVTGITKFGAFVALPDGKSGLVHISEIANTFVSDVSEHVQVGQTVKVKVLSISPEGKINLSIKKAEAPLPRSDRPARAAAPQQRSAPARGYSPRPASTTPPAEMSFEERLKAFMADSDSKNSGNRLYAEKRTSRRRGNK